LLVRLLFGAVFTSVQVVHLIVCGTEASRFPVLVTVPSGILTAGVPDRTWFIALAALLAAEC